MHTTRRGYLAALAGTTVVGLSGCLGASGSSDSSTSSGSSTSSTSSNSSNSSSGGSNDKSSLPAPVAGNPKADVVVKAWEDFACPHCAEYSTETYPKIKSKYVKPGKIRYEHHDLPIPVSKKWSWAVGSAARAVQVEAGDDAYFQFSHNCYEHYVNGNAYTYDFLAKTGKKVGATPSKVRKAAENNTYKAVLKKDRQSGIDAGANATPAVFVNDKQVSFKDAKSYWGPVHKAIENAL